MEINVLMLAQLNTEYRNFGKKKWGKQVCLAKQGWGG